jgi:hypothetical protein
LSSEPLSSLEQNFQELAMENNVERAVGATVGFENRAEGVARTKKEWVAPELKKIDIEEVTANGGILSSDGLGSS